MKNFENISEYYNQIKLDYPTLSDYELLSIAVQMQHNDILRAGLVVSQADSHPSALEGITMQLGIGSGNV